VAQASRVSPDKDSVANSTSLPCQLPKASLTDCGNLGARLGLLYNKQFLKNKKKNSS